jgi:general secretion pathway protein G
VGDFPQITYALASIPVRLLVIALRQLSVRQIVKAAPLLIVAIPGFYFLLFGDYFRNAEPARAAAATSQIESLQRALGTYLLDTGDFPSEAQGLQALRLDPGVERWNGPYLQKEVPRDPWGAPYVYRLVDGKPLILASHH